MKNIINFFFIVSAAGFFVSSSFAEGIPSVSEQAKGVDGMKRQGTEGTSNENSKGIVDENGGQIFTTTTSTPASGDPSKKSPSNNANGQ